MGIVNEAVKDGVGICRVADEGVPFVDGDLTGEDGRAAPIAFFEDFVEVTTSTGVEGFEAPIVEYEELNAGETAQDAGIATVTAGEGQDLTPSPTTGRGRAGSDVNLRRFFAEL